ncbi:MULTISPECIES: class I SAM-dependent methyltransferase [Acidiphilium]|uniref:Methyltransferase domain-containing protein n=1 Tax=Acidiphilium rubrum TaxID=526 RepID=A0A8G2FFM8_ACIRU|nr:MULTISPECIES: class I SAM-dependent methyltransferase [Acidiphilium]MBW4036071.1 class I SAM-dependent methyltransferase [Pseudomonadota bacterium]SIQ36639.1 Methyltransferase domain-containing protein [Acidiphilium rubrum]
MHAASLRVLDARHFRSGLEIGCGSGRFTHALAGRCDALLATEGDAARLMAAQIHCAALHNVQFAPDPMPHLALAGSFDLIALLHRLNDRSDREILALARTVLRVAAPITTVLLVNHTGRLDRSSGNDRAVGLFIEATADRLRRSLHRRASHYRIDVLQSR